MFWISLAPARAQDGAYLVRIAGCADCHTVEPGQAFAGGLRLDTPFGSFFTPNLTSDMETGLGNWTLEDFKQALHGKSPEGIRYYPVFPYGAYSQITDEDAEKIWDYLRAQEPIYKRKRSQLVSFPYSQRILLWGWQELFLAPTYDPSEERGAEWNRGAYLAEALAHCTECHTPRNYFGALKSEEWMSGGNIPVGGRLAPNITPDKLTGLGTWSAQDWNRFLASGRTPQGRFPAAEMAQVIQNTSALTAEDRRALIVYLMSLKPIERGVDEPQ